MQSHQCFYFRSGKQVISKFIQILSNSASYSTLTAFVHQNMKASPKIQDCCSVRPGGQALHFQCPDWRIDDAERTADEPPCCLGLEIHSTASERTCGCIVEAPPQKSCTELLFCLLQPPGRSNSWPMKNHLAYWQDAIYIIISLITIIFDYILPFSEDIHSMKSLVSLSELFAWAANEMMLASLEPLSGCEALDCGKVMQSL